MIRNSIIIKTSRLGCENIELSIEEGYSIKEFRDIEKLLDSVKIFKEADNDVLELANDYILMDGDQLFLVNKVSAAATIKCLGRVWSIHYNDADPFPSNFHAHDEENGDKLDLYTGNKYNKSRQLIGKVRIKNLKGFLEELSRRACYQNKADEILKSIQGESA